MHTKNISDLWCVTVPVYAGAVRKTSPATGTYNSPSRGANTARSTRNLEIPSATAPQRTNSRRRAAHRRSVRCTYLFPCVAKSSRGVTLTLTDVACPWPCLCGPFTVTTTTEMPWRATNCFFSCRKNNPVEGPVPLLVFGRWKHRIFITRGAYHWSMALRLHRSSSVCFPRGNF